MSEVSWQPTANIPTVEAERLLKAAADAAENAYARYSHFRVGAAVLALSGKIYVGVNVENSSFPVGTCAESAALAAARAEEGKQFSLVAIAIVAFRGGAECEACSPCGACRQRIVEFSPKAQVLFFDG